MKNSHIKHRSNTKISISLKHPKQGTKHQNILATNFFAKPYLRANGPILPLALRPGLVVLLILFSIAGTFVINNLTQNNSASATSITLSIPNSLSLDINGASPSGTFAKSSPATISTKTDSTTGYTLSIKSKDSVDGNCLKSDSNSNSSKINSISSNMTEDEFRNSAPMNTWGYQPDKFNSIANSNFLPGPTNAESILGKTTAANSVLGNNYNIVLAAKVNTELPAGIYKNTYILSATSNALNYSVTYNLNSGTWSGKSPQIGQASGTEFKLDSNIPTKQGYKFVGWCTKETSDTSCSGGVYQAGATYDINCDNNDINLWAMWEFNLPMQEFSCNLLATVGDSVTIKDSRDYTTYTVAKLADQKCWMTDNLRISGKTLTSADSDVASNFNLPSSSASGFNNFDTAYVYIDKVYGGYYNWFTATAGEGKKNKPSNDDTSHSICPKGWKLPSKVEYDNLVISYGGTSSSDGRVLQNPLTNFLTGGYYDTNKLYFEGKSGYYWSSTIDTAIGSVVYSDEIASGLFFGSTCAGACHRLTKSYGLSVRCVSRQ